MEIIDSIVNSLIVAATVCPWWIYVFWLMAIIVALRKSEDITGFWPNVGWGVWTFLQGVVCLTLAIAVAR